MSWIFFGILAGISFGFYNFFTKISSGKFSPTVASMFITGTAFIIFFLFNIINFFVFGKKLEFQKNDLLKPFLGGLFYSLALLFYLIMFKKGKNLFIGNFFVSIILTLTVFILSFIFLRESLMWYKIIIAIIIVFVLFFLVKS